MIATFGVQIFVARPTPLIPALMALNLVIAIQLFATLLTIWTVFVKPRLLLSVKLMIRVGTNAEPRVRLVPTRTANRQVAGRAVFAVHLLSKHLIVAGQPRTPACIRIALRLEHESERH
jgi:hypothetical protein